MKVLVIGGAGYLGTPLTQLFVSNRNPVICVDKLDHSNYDTIKQKFELSKQFTKQFTDGKGEFIFVEDNIKNIDGLAYIDGEVTYTNWPMIMSKEGNRKVFLETKWANPFEQTWMSHVFQKQKEDYIKSAVLLAYPIWHDRIKYYKPEEIRENAG